MTATHVRFSTPEGPEVLIPMDTLSTSIILEQKPGVLMINMENDQAIAVSGSMPRICEYFTHYDERQFRVVGDKE